MNNIMVRGYIGYILSLVIGVFSSDKTAAPIILTIGLVWIFHCMNESDKEEKK